MKTAGKIRLAALMLACLLAAGCSKPEPEPALSQRRLAARTQTTGSPERRESAAGREEAIERSPEVWPPEVMGGTRTDEKHYYFVGLSSGARTLVAGREEALADAANQVVKTAGIEVTTEHREERRVSSRRLGDEAARSASTEISRIEIRGEAWLAGGVGTIFCYERTTRGFNCRVVYRYPRRGIATLWRTMAEKLRKRLEIDYYHHYSKGMLLARAGSDRDLRDALASLERSRVLDPPRRWARLIQQQAHILRERLAARYWDRYRTLPANQDRAHRALELLQQAEAHAVQDRTRRMLREAYYREVARVLVAHPSISTHLRAGPVKIEDVHDPEGIDVGDNALLLGVLGAALAEQQIVVVAQPEKARSRLRPIAGPQSIRLELFMADGRVLSTPLVRRFGRVPPAAPATPGLAMDVGVRALRRTGREDVLALDRYMEEGTPVASGEGIRVEISLPREPAYIYVLNRDARRTWTVLFPPPPATPSPPSNPRRQEPGGFEIYPTRNGEPGHWPLDEVTGIEEILVLASRHPIPSPLSWFQGPGKRVLEQSRISGAGARKRGIVRVAGKDVVARRFWFQHTR